MSTLVRGDITNAKKVYQFGAQLNSRSFGYILLGKLFSFVPLRTVLIWKQNKKVVAICILRTINQTEAKDESGSSEAENRPILDTVAVFCRDKKRSNERQISRLDLPSRVTG